MNLIKSLANRFFSNNSALDPESNDDSLLGDAVHNALLIVMTASENAIPLDADAIEVIIITKEALKADTVDAQLESEFWQAYEKISQRILPITISSIKANFDPKPSNYSLLGQLFSRKKIPLSRQCASSYKAISLVTLLLLIIVQIYWYIGWSITSDIITQADSISELEDILTEEKYEYANSSRILNVEDDNILKLKQLKIQNKIKEHAEWRDAATHHLQNWNEVWSNMDFLTLQPWQNPDYQTYPVEVQKRIQFVAAGNTLEAITEYILPILYGLIGACFYILRQLPKEIESLTFSMNSYINYSLRMAQGPLAGIMVSYFIAPSQDNSLSPALTESSASQVQHMTSELSTLSPLALAFLAGYSVEFIFKFIDKMLTSPVTPPSIPAQNKSRQQMPSFTRTAKQAPTGRTQKKPRTAKKPQ